MDLSAFVPDPSRQPELHITTVTANELTPDLFRERFDQTETPVLITGAKGGGNSGGAGGGGSGEEDWGLMNDWKARTTWSVETLCEKYGDKLFKVGNEYRPGGPITVDMKFGDYINYMRTQHDETPLYVFDPSFGERAPTMLEEYKVPHIFEEDMFSHLGPHRPPYRWLVVGPSRSGATWHIDPLGTSAWNALLQGRKRWALYPPNIIPPGVQTLYKPSSPSESESESESSPHGQILLDFSTPFSTLQWYLEIYPYLPPEERPIECIQHPGE
ncbi:hypothetical protein HK102_010852, partial [Quaeritorhiza haematococci]